MIFLKVHKICCSRFIFLFLSAQFILICIIMEEIIDLAKIEQIAFSMRFVDDEFSIQELIEKQLNFNF